MSLTGRLVIDRLKRAVSSYVRLPVPPYGNTNYWESSYKSLGPNDVNEWGVSLEKNLLKYRYQPIPLPSDLRIALGTNPTSTSPSPSSKHTQQHANDPPDDARNKSDNPAEKHITTSFGETIQVYPEAAYDEPILIIGCGNSKFGEDMLNAKWRGPVIQVDVSSRVCDAMSIRCAPHLSSGNMQVVQDDATILSAIADGRTRAVIDKGLLDAFFCADEYNQVTDCLRAVHRVLEPGGCFVTFSLSQPEFFLSRLLMPPHGQQRLRIPWQRVEIRQLDTILLYRFTKRPDKALPRHAGKSRHRKK